MKCEHGFEHCGLCHDKAGNLWPHLGESSASPTCSTARIAEIKRELRSLCPSEAYHAASKFEAELIANRMMDRVAELLNMIQSR